MINELINYYKDKKILILGFGMEGKSTYKVIRNYLPSQKLYISDKKQNIKNENDFLKNDKNIEIIEGNEYLNNLQDYDIIMKSPGIVLKDIDISKIKNKIKSQLELLLQFFNIKSIGITGTKGKSTTSSLIYKMIEDQGKEVLFLGNIGKPIFDYLDKIKENMYIVLEISSHQLEFVDLSPNIAVFLNVYEEHLDHYSSLDSYIEAKCNIFSHQKETDYYIYNSEIKAIKEKNKKYETKANKYAITLNNNNIESPENLVTYKDNKIYINENEIYNANNNRKLLGIHNLNNIMFVLAVSDILKLDLNKTINTINDFEALPHRIEYVGKYNDIIFYNDSIATIPEATINSIEALKNVNTLIIGGLDREIDYSKFIDYLNNSKIENVICLPSTGHKIGKQLNSNINKTFVDNLEEAVEIAKKYTKKDTICLLSPAAASYGFFKNFEERGNKFKELVKKTSSQE